MSLTGSMNTAVSGLQAQASKLSTVGDNVANSDTTGYKRVETAFSSLVVGSAGSGSYNSGGVQTTTTQTISQAGSYSSTTSSTDLAVNGDGYFVVQNDAGDIFLTRAGDFKEDENGYLVNSAGYTLLGYSYDNGEPASVINGFDGLEPVKVSQSTGLATASSSGTLSATLNSSSAIHTGDAPSDNLATSTYTNKSSMVAYDSFGNSVLYDIYYTKTADNEWDVSVYRNADATAGTGFPYSSSAVASETLTFDSTQKLDASSPSTLSLSDSNISPTLNISLDLSGMTQSNTSFSSTGTLNGNKASSGGSISIDSSGNITSTSSDGTVSSLYKVALATVASPDNLKSVSGTAYQVTADAGTVVVGFANTGSFGTINSKTLEASNVDLATELTNMIQSQRSYSANSKVFQTAADMLDTLISLKR
jgi:flagellar hook protein FlgE